MAKNGSKIPLWAWILGGGVLAALYLKIFKKSNNVSIDNSIKTASENQDKDKNRGQKNNNPLNLRNTQTVLPGQIKTDSAGFNVFSSIEYGYRAAIKQLWRYYDKYNVKTVSKIVEKWAPPKENNTAAYIAFVSKDMGVSSDKVLDFDITTYSKLISAMSLHETGMRPTAEQLEKAWELSKDGKTL